MTADDRWDEFLDDIEQAEQRGEPPAPTHRVKIQADIEFTIVLPPWGDADDALTEILTALGDHDLAYKMTEYRWTYDDPQIERIDGGVTGSTGSIEAAA